MRIDIFKTNRNIRINCSVLICSLVFGACNPREIFVKGSKNESPSDDGASRDNENITQPEMKTPEGGSEKTVERIPVVEIPPETILPITIKAPPPVSVPPPAMDVPQVPGKDVVSGSDPLIAQPLVPVLVEDLTVAISTDSHCIQDWVSGHSAGIHKNGFKTFKPENVDEGEGSKQRTLVHYKFDSSDIIFNDDSDYFVDSTYFVADRAANLHTFYTISEKAKVSEYDHNEVLDIETYIQNLQKSVPIVFGLDSAGAFQYPGNRVAYFNQTHQDAMYRTHLNSVFSSSDMLQVKDEMTFEAIVNFNKVDSGSVITLLDQGLNKTTFELKVRDGIVIASLLTQTSPMQKELVLEHPQVIVPHKWYHLAAVIRKSESHPDQLTLKLYVNGQSNQEESLGSKRSIAMIRESQKGFLDPLVSDFSPSERLKSNSKPILDNVLSIGSSDHSSMSGIIDEIRVQRGAVYLCSFMNRIAEVLP